MKKYLFLFAAAVLAGACGESTTPTPSQAGEDSTTQGNIEEMAKPMDVYTFPGEYPADKPADLMAYFDSLHTYCGAEVWSHESSKDSALVWKDVAELNRYAKGERKFFPAEEVKSALNTMAFAIGYGFSHGTEETEDTVWTGEVFFFRLLEQAARLTPKIDYVTSFHATEGDAGILFFHEWSPLPLYSFLIYPKDNGYGVQMVDKRGEVEIKKVFTLKDSDGRIYYLCSNNTDGMEFGQYVYLREENGVKLVANTRSMLCSEGDHYYDAIVFNPQRLCWEYCTGKDGNYRRVEGSPAMKLILDGNKTHFDVN